METPAKQLFILKWFFLSLLTPFVLLLPFLFTFTHWGFVNCLPLQCLLMLLQPLILLKIKSGIYTLTCCRLHNRPYMVVCKKLWCIWGMLCPSSNSRQGNINFRQLQCIAVHAPTSLHVSVHCHVYGDVWASFDALYPIDTLEGTYFCMPDGCLVCSKQKWVSGLFETKVGHGGYINAYIICWHCSLCIYIFMIQCLTYKIDV